MDADLTRKLSYVALKQKIACHSITVELRSATKPGRFAVLGSRPFAVARRPSR
jgi:hypothetical protein